MDNIKFVKTNTGFILGFSDMLDVIKPINNNFINNFILSSKSSILQNVNKFYEENEIYTSNLLLKALNDYTYNKTFNNFIELLIYTYQLFNKINFIPWCHIQSTSPTMSNISKLGFYNLLDAAFHDKPIYRSYIYAPLTTRVIFNINNKSQEEINKDLYELKKHLNGVYKEWDDFLILLVKKNLLIDFIHLVFIDENISSQ